MFRKRTDGKVPDCNKCSKKRVKLIEENYTTYSIIEKYGSLFMDGMGGININTIKEIVNFYDLDDDEKLTTTKLIVSFFKTAKSIGDNSNAKK